MALGLFHHYNSTNPMNCTECNDFGAKFADINKFMVQLEDQRGLWIDKNKIMNLKFFEMFSQLMKVYPLFTDFFSSLNAIFSSPIIQTITGGTTLLATGSGFTTTSGQPKNMEVVTGLTNNILGAWDMIANIPGSTCFQVGYKVTAALRFA
ncbi:MAG: hypothetical protein ACK56F_23805, partial [bacterium]